MKFHETEFIEFFIVLRSTQVLSGRGLKPSVKQPTAPCPLLTGIYGSAGVSCRNPEEAILQGANLWRVWDAC